MKQFKEADIIINDVKLDSSQSMAIRVAIEQFRSLLNADALGKDAISKMIKKSYLRRINDIISAIYGNEYKK
jgi:hypothetical protein